MDTQGLPVPFSTVIYQGENGMGVKNLVDLDHDGRAELLISTYDEQVSDPLVGGFCSGHWVTQLYRFNHLRAEEVRGTIGGIAFPFVHNWTYRGGQCEQMEKPFLDVMAPAIHEHGTAASGEVRTAMLRVNAEALDAFDIDPVAGCQTIQWSNVVYDRPAMREIAFVNLWNPAAKDMVEAILSDGVPIRLSGLDQIAGQGFCTANLLWADGARDR